MNTSLGDQLHMRDGHSIPQLGVGLYKMTDENVNTIVPAALDLGYRLFDTAAMYENEAALGAALATSGAPREEIYVTSKVLNSDHGYDQTRAACRRSLDLLGLDYLDLYLIHWPAPRQNRYVEAWEAIQSLVAEGLVRSAGVSNFHAHHLDRLERAGLPTPQLNQVECHPRLQQEELFQLQNARGILTQAWSPLARGSILQNPVLQQIAARHDATIAQVTIAWHLSRGIGVIPKTASTDRLAENARSVEILLDDADLAAIATIDDGTRTGVDPDDRD